MAEQMKAAVLVDAKKFEIRDVPVPCPAPGQVLLRATGVGICGTDLHIYGGFANYNFDATGASIPLSRQPQILGHELSGIVEEVGREVRTFKAGDQVIVDQNLNCFSQRVDPICEFCASGDSHQCLNYKEYGITGLPGGFGQYVAVPAVNVIRIHGDLPREQAALAETFGCVLHAMEFTERAGARYSFTGERRIRNVLILGAGPGGLFFIQYLRNVLHFDGPIFVADLHRPKLKLAESFGATPIASSGEDFVEEILDHTRGEKIYFLVEATGAGEVFHFIPRIIRKQATVVLYGVGHEGAGMSLLNALQFIEPTLVAPVGASGGFDAAGRSLTYMKSMHYLVSGCIKAAPLVTDPCELPELPRVFAEEWARPDFIKAVLVRP